MKLQEWLRRCNFHLDRGGTIRHCDTNYETDQRKPKEDGSGELSFDVRFFNQKSVAMGLHKLRVKFTKWRIPWCRRVTHRADVTSAGGKRVDVMTLEPNRWLVTKRQAEKQTDGSPMTEPAEAMA